MKGPSNGFLAIIKDIQNRAILPKKSWALRDPLTLTNLDEIFCGMLQNIVEAENALAENI